MSEIVRLYDPPYKLSKNVYSHIKENLEDWVEEALRNNTNITIKQTFSDCLRCLFR